MVSFFYTELHVPEVAFIYLVLEAVTSNTVYELEAKPQEQKEAQQRTLEQQQDPAQGRKGPRPVLY
ncbi:unnamed protein product [Urochloa humidicola]